MEAVDGLIPEPARDAVLLLGQRARLEQRPARRARGRGAGPPGPVVHPERRSRAGDRRRPRFCSAAQPGPRRPSRPVAGGCSSSKSWPTAGAWSRVSARESGSRSTSSSAGRLPQALWTSTRAGVTLPQCPWTRSRRCRRTASRPPRTGRASSRELGGDRSAGGGPAATIAHRRVTANGVELHVAELGTGRPIVFCHGFPSCGTRGATSCRRSQPAGYRALAPDMRGYGERLGAGADRGLRPAKPLR